MSVTLKPKRFSNTVFVCLGCDLLACSERSDALTCSSQCRVSAHRSGRAQRRREIAEDIDVPPSLIGQIEACRRLLPADMLDRLRSGQVEIHEPEIRAAIWQAFWPRLIAAVRRIEAERRTEAEQ
jgi:hypothetical protein